MRSSMKFFVAFVLHYSSFAISSFAATPMTIGLLVPTISADGTSSAIVTLFNTDGTLYSGPPVIVNFSSACSQKGTAIVDGSVLSVGGIAAATYQPRACSGADTITANTMINSIPVSASVSINILTTRSLSNKASIGKAIFFDKVLSANGQQSCASCHSPSNGYFAANNLDVQLGGTDGQKKGFRSAPTAAYSSFVPPFSFAPATSPGAGSTLGKPRGGLFWDGRATKLSDQAQGPFLAANEMANATSTDVLKKLLTRPYLSQFSKVYGTTTSTSDPNIVLANIGDAIGAFEREEKSLKLFNSKYDAVQAGLAIFTVQEQNGLALFTNNTKAACSGCHFSGGSQTNPPPQTFSDQSYRVLGVPRNWNIPYNNDSLVLAALTSINSTSLINGTKLGSPNHQFFDMGLCGSIRSELTSQTTLCGAFRVPTLRNIALKSVYNHNGVFSSLDQVINFYLSRDVNPQSIYKQADGSVDIRYNDLPVSYQSNIEVRAPFTPLKTGTRLTNLEIQDLITFLCTLSDGYDPTNPQSYRLPSQCRAAIR